MIHTVASFSGFSCDDISAARAFYVDVLGLRLIDDTMGLNLELPGGGRHFVYEKPDHTPAGFTVLNFVVDDIEATVKDLADKGVVFERYDLGHGITQDELGILRGLSVNMGPDIAWFKDPAGNVLSVLQDEA